MRASEDTGGADRGPGSRAPATAGPGRKARVLLVRLSALGDVVHALPVLAALRASWPEAEVDWAVEDRCAGLLEGRRDLGRVVVLPRRALGAPLRHPLRSLRAARAFLRTLRSASYDAVLDLQGNLKSGLVARAARARVRVGLDRPHAREGNHLLSTRRVRPSPRARHRVERNLAVLAGLLGRPVAWRAPEVPPDPAAAEAVEAALARARLPPTGFALLQPGTSAFGELKRWPAERFGALARSLAERGLAVAVLAAPGEEALAEEVARASGGAAVLLPSPSVPFLVEAVRLAGFLVAADTGPLHLASAVGTPVVGLFGPKDPEVYAPYGRRADGTPGALPVVVREDVACRPCGLRRCADPLCMRGLEPAAVVERLEALGLVPGRSPPLGPPPVRSGGLPAPA